MTSYLLEDIDPSIGRFRNLVQSSVVIPAKVETPPTNI